VCWRGSRRNYMRIKRIFTCMYTNMYILRCTCMCTCTCRCTWVYVYAYVYACECTMYSCMWTYAAHRCVTYSSTMCTYSSWISSDTETNRRKRRLDCICVLVWMCVCVCICIWIYVRYRVHIRSINLNLSCSNVVTMEKKQEWWHLEQGLSNMTWGGIQCRDIN
jgi:hypothetical protein